MGKAEPEGKTHRTDAHSRLGNTSPGWTSGHSGLLAEMQGG